jgi:hypothetical protein
MPNCANCWARYWALLLRISPSSISVPTQIISALMGVKKELGMGIWEELVILNTWLNIGLIFDFDNQVFPYLYLSRFFPC